VHIGMTFPNTGLKILDTNASNELTITPGSDLTADRTLTLTTGDADRTITLSGNPTLADWFDQAVKQASSPTFDDLTLSNPSNIYALSHDSFSGFVANEHIDHTSVTLTAGTGLSGGGDISASRTFAVDLNELTTETSIAADDFLAMVDVTDSGSGKITFANLEAALNHDNLAGFDANEHFTMLDEDDMASNSDTQAATQQSIKAYVDYSVTSLGASYYLVDTSSGVADYKLCSLIPSEDAETYLEAADLSDNDYIGGWISDTGETPDILLTGNFNFYITAEKTTGTQTLKLHWKMYERKADTSEVLIATSSITNEVTDKDTFVLPFLLTSDYIPASDSRIVGKIYASVTGGGNAPTVRIYYRGNTAARWDIPANSEVFRSIFVPYANAVQDVDLNGHSITGIDNITVADESWIGIGASDERIVFDTAGNISFMGCKVGIGATEASYKLSVYDGSMFASYPDGGTITYSNVDSTHDDNTKGLYAIFAGDIHLRSFWGISIDLDEGAASEGSYNGVFGANKEDVFGVRWRNGQTDTYYTRFMVEGGSGNVGVNTTTPRKQIDSLSISQAQLRLSYSDDSVYADFQVGSTGELDITPNGSAPNVDITTHDGSTQGLKLGGTLITKNAAEINDLEALVNLPSDEDLVGYWSFDDGSGSVAVDGSGNGNDGTLVNMEDANWVDGIVGKCLDFDGTTQYVTSSTSPSVSGNFSISVHIKRQGTGSGLNNTIIDVGNYTANNGFGLWINDSNELTWRINQDYNHYSVGIPTLDTWRHYVLVYNGTTVKVYEDGIEIYTTNYSTNPTVVTNYMRAGKRESTNNEYFNGLIDEVRIYNRALTPSEVKALYLYPAGNKGCRISTRQIGQSGDVISETDETKFSHKMPITIDGTAYYVMLTQT